MRNISVILITLISVCITNAQPPDILWAKTFGGDGSDFGYCVQQTIEGGLIVAGKSSSNFDLIKTDESGNALWTQSFGNNFDQGRFVQQTSDGGYIITGKTKLSISDELDVLLIKTDETGNELWSRSFGGMNNDYGYSVQQTSDGGYIIAGMTFSEEMVYDVYLIKTDESGYLEWDQTYGRRNSDAGYSVLQTSDGGYIIAGSSFSTFYRGHNDFLLIKTDENGDQLWSRTLGGRLNDIARCIQQTTDGGFIIAGTTGFPLPESDDILLIKTDQDGNRLWHRTYGGIYDEKAECVQQTTDGGYIVAGWTFFSYPNAEDVYLIRLGNELGIKPHNNILITNFTLHPPHPNPFNPT
ncbi:hypothetical protein KJ564_16830, partial [bacterium]|nr:hypothetical protein [bacterium]